MDKNSQKLSRKALENRDAAEIRREAGQIAYSCEEILGSMVPVHDFAAFFANHKVDLQLIRKTLLLDFVESEFKGSPFEAFKSALDMFYGFFEISEAEVDLYIKEVNRENNAKNT